MMVRSILSVLLVLYSHSVIGQSADEAQAEYDEFMEMLSSYTPQEIEKLRKKLLDVQQAAAKRPNGPVKPTAVTKRIEFRGGIATTAIPLVTGRLSAIGVYDSVNEPWQIEFIQVSDAKRFEVIQRNDQVNTFTVQPLAEAADGNIVLFLVGESEPLVLELSTTTKNFNAKYNVQVSALSPTSKGLSCR